MREIIFQGTNMVKTYGETTVLHGISLELYRGDFAVIMGSSGSGKSTFLYAVSGMDRLSGGQLFYKGKSSSDEMIDIAHGSEKELTRLRAEDFGFVFQRSHSALVNREKEKMYLFSIGYTVLVVLDKPHYLVCKGFPARFAEMDMYIKGGIPYPLHKVGLRVQRGGGAAGLAGVMVHRLSFPFISPFNRSIFPCAVDFLIFSPVKNTGQHISIRRS